VLFLFYGGSLLLLINFGSFDDIKYFSTKKKLYISLKVLRKLDLNFVLERSHLEIQGAWDCCFHFLELASLEIFDANRV